MLNSLKIGRRKETKLQKLIISVTEGSLVSMTNSQLFTVLVNFITAVRNIKGFDYYPKTMHALIICIQRFLRQNDLSTSIFDDKGFSALRSMLVETVCFKKKKKKKKTDVISVDKESWMWSGNNLGTDTSKQPLRYITVLF